MPRHAKTRQSVSEKNTKSEILDAYNNLLGQLEGGENSNAATQEEKKILDTASTETIEKITADLSQLRITANHTISNLTEKLTKEAERFARLKKAIVFAQQELDDTQKVKIKASQLFQIIELQKDAEQKIASLESVVASLQTENKELKVQLDKATNHIKDIAVSVVEGTKKENNQRNTPADSAK